MLSNECAYNIEAPKQEVEKYQYGGFIMIC